MGRTGAGRDFGFAGGKVVGTFIKDAFQFQLHLPSPLEPHHPLDNCLALLGHRIVLGHTIRAVLAHLLPLSTHLHRLQFLYLVVALFACCHVC